MLTTLLNKFFNFDEFAALLGRKIKNQYYTVNSDYIKVKKIIKSCQCEEHLAIANKVITLFYNKHISDFYLKKLENIYIKQKEKFK